MKPIVPLLSALLAAGPAGAQGLLDPTRPPAAITEIAAPAASAGAAAAATAGLQSIIRRQGARPAAVINGSYVELGGKAGEAVLERVDEDSVVLRSATGRETLYLTPGVGKARGPAQAGAAGRSPGKGEKARP